MKTLVAIETSTRSPSVALWCGGEVRTRSLGSERAHASDLLPALDGLLRDADLKPQAVEAVAVGTGPGSYTGLRVGCATALGLARGTGAALRAVPSTEALVWSALEPGREAGVLIDARAGELYFAHYRRGALDVEVVSAPRVVASAEVAGLIPDSLALFADARALAAGGVEALAPNVIGACEPDAGAVARLAALRLEQLGPHTPEQVQPLYLRAFQAKPRKR